MDHIDDLTNEHLTEFFLKDLNCMNQLVAFQYPNWLFDDYSIIDEHIIRCQNILKSYIISEISDCDLTEVEKVNFGTEKFREIMLLCESNIQSLFDNAEFKTTHLIPSQEDNY